MQTERIITSDYTNQIFRISLLQALLSQKWKKAEKTYARNKKGLNGHSKNNQITNRTFRTTWDNSNK